MGKSRMMGAGNASATLYKCDPNIPTGGGNKKQGITSRVGLDMWGNREIQTQSNGIGRFKLICMNQLGGVGAGHSMFGGLWNRADGMKSCNSGIDFSGYDAVYAETPGNGSTLNYNFSNNHVQITNAINLDNITTIILKTDRGDLFIPVKYQNGELVVDLPKSVIEYLIAQFFVDVKFPLNVSIKPYHYVKKSTTAYKSVQTPFIITNTTNVPDNVFVLAFDKNDVIDCLDILTLDDPTSTGKLLFKGTAVALYTYLYYTDTSLTPFVGQYKIKC